MYTIYYPTLGQITQQLGYTYTKLRDPYESFKHFLQILTTLLPTVGGRLPTSTPILPNSCLCIFPSMPPSPTHRCRSLHILCILRSNCLWDHPQHSSSRCRRHIQRISYM